MGKVKTRIAAAMGDENALTVYKHLLQHTKDITEGLPVTRFVFYADGVTANDLWNGYEKCLQSGSDCFELDEKMISDVFLKLNEYEIVIGPAVDGGYYLLGMQSPVKNLFENITWSIDSVFDETVKQIKQKHLSFGLLPVLNDVDKKRI